MTNMDRPRLLPALASLVASTLGNIFIPSSSPSAFRKIHSHLVGFIRRIS